MDSGPDVPIAAIVMPIIGVVGISLMIWGCIRGRRVQKYRSIGPPRGPLQQEWYARISSQISLRIAQEEDTTKGSRVWFSRHINRGRFKHWIVIVDDVKYELRRNNKDYYVNVAPCILDVERRNAAREHVKFPEYDGHYVCLIGWTHYKPGELSEIAHSVGDGWDYSRFTNNCQHFLQLFADRILEPEKAADYPWFRENTRTEYQNSRTPPPTPEELIAMQAAQNQAIHQHYHRHIHTHNQHAHSNHMNNLNQLMLLNLQTQNLATMNAINQSAMVNNNAMMNNPAMNGAMGFGMGGGMGMGMGGAGA